MSGERRAIVTKVFKFPGGTFRGEAITESGRHNVSFSNESYAEPLTIGVLGTHLPTEPTGKPLRTPTLGQGILFKSGQQMTRIVNNQHKLVLIASVWTTEEKWNKDKQ